MKHPVWKRCRNMVAPLHRRIFVWFGVAIIMSSCVGMGVATLFGKGNTSWKSFEGAKRVMANRFTEVWDEPAKREALADEIAREINVDVTLRDASGTPIYVIGNQCSRKDLRLAPMRDGEALGSINMCPTSGIPHPLPMLFGMSAAIGVLWLVAHKIARHLGRPILDLVDVTDAIGRGDYDVNVRMRRHAPSEIVHLTRAVQDMAGKIKQQLADQRELLASVSHEMRSPLARIRLVLEFLRDESLAPARREELHGELEYEIIEIDDLVGGLLAQSRLDFSALTLRPNDLVGLTTRSLARVSLPIEPVVLGSKRPAPCDATLVARALSNLLDNAKKHGGGATDLTVRFEGDRVSVEVSDRGPGLGDREIERIFDPFYGKPTNSAEGLGLGLALVKRIAKAHGGDAFAKNREGGGSTVGFWLALG
jgi:two-component system, OmpR family, sensor kinase